MQESEEDQRDCLATLDLYGGLACTAAPLGRASPSGRELAEVA